MTGIARLNRDAARRASSGGWVYFIAGAGMVKIGATIKAPRLRLQALSLGSPVPLELLAVIPDQCREQEIHELFAGDRSHGEWFRLSAAIDQYVAEARSRYGPLDERYRIPVSLLRQAMTEALDTELVRV